MERASAHGVRELAPAGTRGTLVPLPWKRSGRMNWEQEQRAWSADFQIGPFGARRRMPNWSSALRWKCPDAPLLRPGIRKQLSPRTNRGKLHGLMQQVNLGIIGGGTVGGGVFQAIQRNGALFASRLGVKLHIAKMVVRDVHKPRPVKIPPALLTTDWAGVVNDPQVHLVVELMGGTATARAVVLRALKLGNHPIRPRQIDLVVAIYATSVTGSGGVADSG